MESKIKAKSVSVVIPAYNEGEELVATIEDVNKIISNFYDDYEILIFDDCSTDNTGDIADNIAAKNPRIRVFHNKKNMNMGYNFLMGIKNSGKEYVMLLSGPDSVSLKSIQDFISKIGQADVISSYIANQSIRQRYRRVISFLVTNALNIMLGLRLRYYFGMQAYKIEVAKKLKITTNSFGTLAELIIRAIKMGYTHREFPYNVRPTKGKSTTAFRQKNVIGIISLVLRLFYELRVLKSKKYLKILELNKHVYYSKNRITRIKKADIQAFVNRAMRNSPNNVRLCVHKDVNDMLHEMFIIFGKDSYIRPHKHPGKSVSYHIIGGYADIVLFNENGKIAEVISMGSYSSNKIFYFRINEAFYYMPIIKSPYLVFHEVTNGPFNDFHTVYAPWAPEPNDYSSVNKFTLSLSKKINDFKLKNGK